MFSFCYQHNKLIVFFRYQTFKQYLLVPPDPDADDLIFFVTAANPSSAPNDEVIITIAFSAVLFICICIFPLGIRKGKGKERHKTHKLTQSTYINPSSPLLMCLCQWVFVESGKEKGKKDTNAQAHTSTH